ncbi:hypothetical protein [Bacillus marasmi]|uniref:hypothetical protein n=1 Tax=Bacillus marasmi TaxID=1926279 RepID=UPI0011C82AE3|nr:hypothetical protein [Bacillus marasmi]
MHFFIFKRKTLAIFFIIFCSLFVTTIWLFVDSQKDIPTIQPNEKPREIHLVTGEFKAKTLDGKEIEAYRWDPGTIFIKEGEKVQLKVFGVNGREHPFIIEGTNIKGTVKQNEETDIPLQFSDEGIYRLICLTHSDKEHEGPMIAYIIVD